MPGWVSALKGLILTQRRSCKSTSASHLANGKQHPQCFAPHTPQAPAVGEAPHHPGERCSPLATRPMESTTSRSALTQREVWHDEAGKAQQQQGQHPSLPGHVRVDGS